MSMRVKVALVTLNAALPAFFLSRILWPMPPGTPAPDGALLPFFVLLGVLEALVFGSGVSFLAFGLPVVRRAAERAGVAPWPVYVVIGWSLVSWWPHNNMHLANGLRLEGLLVIEYVFHVSLYVTGLIIAWFFLRTLCAQRPAEAAR